MPCRCQLACWEFADAGASFACAVVTVIGTTANADRAAATTASLLLLRRVPREAMCVLTDDVCKFPPGDLISTVRHSVDR